MRKGRARIIRFPKLDPKRPAQDQLKSYLRELILSGAIGAGARMPAQRLLARDSGFSRNTVTIVYETLISEGLLEARRGAGTFVVRTPTKVFSKRRIATVDDPRPELPLHQGVHDFSLFPLQLWRRLQDRRWRALESSALGYGDAAGWSGLRFILAQRLAATRGIACSAEQVIIVPTAMSAIRLISATLGARGRKVWVESPTYTRVTEMFQDAGADIVHVPVDAQGMVVSEGVRAAPDASFAFVTPVAQFPTGAPMSWKRRKELLQWAKAAGAWVVEDDYESDFAFEGEAMPALAGEAGADRVIYLSTLNNLFFPSMQLACLVVPETLIDTFRAHRRAMDGSVNTPLQMVIHDFIDGGHLAAHLRRCREAYAERRDVLRAALTSRAAGSLSLVDQPVGLHAMAWLPSQSDDGKVQQLAAAEGVVVHAVSDPNSKLVTRPGIYMGFAGFAPSAIKAATPRLLRALEVGKLL